MRLRMLFKGDDQSIEVAWNLFRGILPLDVSPLDGQNCCAVHKLSMTFTSLAHPIEGTQDATKQRSTGQWQQRKQHLAQDAFGALRPVSRR